MAQIDRLRKRGATYTLATRGEVLFLPGTELSRWKNRFSQRIRAATAAAAPSNKRPRWNHYGKPLKSTFTANTATRITRNGGFYYIAVGSSAPYAGFVDQGTGVYRGNSPWKARILPPTAEGASNLYERTWRPTGLALNTLGMTRDVYIKGQRAQNFMQTGLEKATRSMRLRSYQLPGEGVSAISGSVKFPPGLAASVGPKSDDEKAAFQTSLEEWRTWRDAAFNGGRDLLTGRARNRKSRARGRLNRRTPEQNERRREESRKRSQRRRDALNKARRDAENKKRADDAKGFNARKAQARTDFVESIKARGGGNAIIPDSIKFVNGRWTAKVFPRRSGNRLARPITIQGPLVK